MIRLGDLFQIDKGNGFYLKDMKIGGDINYISMSGENNGVSASVHKVDAVEPYSKGLITVAMQGTVLSTFLQPKDFYTSLHVAVLSPKINMTDREKLFYCSCIESNKFRYSYGRKANKTLKDILVPSPDEIPSWVYEVEIPNYSNVTKSYLDEPTPALNVEEWKEFRLDELFEITRGRRITKKYISENTGIIPVIAGGEQNQGILGYMSESLKDEFVFMDKCITVSAFGSTGSVLFHDYSCYIDDKAIALQLRKGLPDNTFIMLFLTTLLQQEKYRYNYGRGVLVDRYKMHDIKLPATLEGNPDWEWMEKYMKTLGWSREV